MKRAHPALGIDLGTTNSAVAFVDSTGRPETIRNAEGGLSTPSDIFLDRVIPVKENNARCGKSTLRDTNRLRPAS